MAADINSVTLVGRPTRDPELRHTQSGTPVASVRLAFSNSVKRNGEWTDESNYVDVTVFGGMAETVATYVTKGKRVGVQGRLSWREWQANDGSKRQSLEIIADRVQFLDSRADGTGGARQQAAPAPAGARSDSSGWDQAGAEPQGGAADDEQFPF